MKLGLAAEDAVCRHLESLGHTILERNWVRPWGEIDIVSRCGPIIHFTEVKSSSCLVVGFEPFLRASPRKMAKVARTAKTWLAYRKMNPETQWQIDVASVIMDDACPTIELFRYV